MSLSFSAGGYVAVPLDLTWCDDAGLADAAWRARYIVKRCSEHEAFFSDYMKDSAAAREAVIHTLNKPDAMLWEVRKASEAGIDLIGILRLSELIPGCSAMAHYFFFDGRLNDKTALLQAWQQLGFGALGLHRVTIEVPMFAKALASHARRRLNFVDEGCMREAIKWRGAWHDTLILGCVADG